MSGLATKLVHFKQISDKFSQALGLFNSDLDIVKLLLETS